ncbi:MAG TPA: endonuclease/exonuclease/phosphatase family protein, partial [Nitrospiria bacterium]|nr:endonuclease/exonuclease/phosphatase family protein [Nitrospiria bacterium]
AAQKRTEALGSGLLQGGSSYSNAYSGGAAESHFCPATLPIGENEKAGTFFKKLIFLVLHAGSLIPVAALMVLEAGLAVLDFIRGLIAGQDLAKELKFVPTRVAICILLRELITIGARIDIARGLPVIHLNYLGYDEQAHRRGPSSAFAHWTLKGIDGAIKKLWYSARRSSRRDYAVWVFSDHGQEETVPYEEETGRTIDEAVAWVFGRSVRKAPAGRFGSKGIQLQRAGWLGGRIAAWVFGSHVIKPAPLVTAVGPLGFIYPASPLSEEDRIRIARDLVRAAGIPLVMIPDGKDRARVWTPRGEFLFPVDAKEVLGEDHPFLEAAARDMTALASHPDAGSFVISGWRPGRQSVSFPNENGAHAGPGSLETLAFLMVPPGTPLEMQRGKPLRAMDIRKAVQQTLHHPRVSLKKLYRGGPRRRTGIRIMTYNVHSCIGMDRRVAPDRIARVIAEFDPDVVALQELDVGRHRTQKTDQAHILAEQLQMAHHFHPAIHVEEEKYGDAVLSRLPMRLIKAA